MNLNQLKELAQKKKGRDVPCDALESALGILDIFEHVTKETISDYKREAIKLNQVINKLEEEKKAYERFVNEKILEPSNQSNKVTRFEVITQDGRAYVNNKCSIELSYQDDGRTLKVFVK